MSCLNFNILWIRVTTCFEEEDFLYWAESLLSMLSYVQGITSWGIEVTLMLMPSLMKLGFIKISLSVESGYIQVDAVWMQVWQQRVAENVIFSYWMNNNEKSVGGRNPKNGVNHVHTVSLVVCWNVFFMVMFVYGNYCSMPS